MRNPVLSLLLVGTFVPLLMVGIYSKVEMSQTSKPIFFNGVVVSTINQGSHLEVLVEIPETNEQEIFSFSRKPIEQLYAGKHIKVSEMEFSKSSLFQRFTDKEIPSCTRRNIRGADFPECR